MLASMRLGKTALGAALGLWTTAALAAPQYVRLSYTGDAATSMTVAWNTTASTATEVLLGTSPGSYTQTFTGASLQANAGLGHVHEVTLTGLSPNTKYYYVAGNTADGFSQEASFTTGPVDDPECGKLRFAFAADNRPDPTFGGGQNWPQILAQAAAHQPAFVLNGGDMVIDGKQVSQWLTFLNDTTAVARRIPFMPVLGNHDDGPVTGAGANYNQIFALPVSTGAHGSSTEDYYYFTYGNAIFVSLSTESFTGGSIPFATQAAWLDEVLTQNPKKWKFVYYHKPSYTKEVLFSISHEPNEANQNAALVPIIDKHHVDVVFASHNHWYERFEPSNCTTKGTPGSSSPCSTGASGFASGTVYIVSGGAGAFTIPGFLCGGMSGRATCSGDHHYVLVDINDETLKLETWGAAPQPNQIIDTISITKAAANCATAPDGGLGDAGTDASAAGAGGGAGTPAGGSAGAAASGGTGASASGGTAGGVGGASDDGGCGCRVDGRPGGRAPALALGALALFVLRRRRARRLTAT